MSDPHSSEFLRHAARALAAMPGASATILALPRLVWLERVAAQAMTPQQLSEALCALPAPLQGWWQTADELVIATPTHSLPSPVGTEWAQLLQGEWTAGSQTLQVTRVGHTLRMARLVEHAQPHPGAVPMLASDHTQVPRQDLARDMVVTTYAQWSDAMAQVAPVAQRLKHLQPLEARNASAQEAA